MRASKRMPTYLGIAAASLGLGTQSALAEGVSQAIEEIIVTARAREESLQVIPFSIQAITSEMIANRDLRRLEELVQITPGLLYEPVATGLSGNPVIRGQANTATTARIQNTAVFLNGVYLQRQSMINPGLLEMERIEVLKGPQSAAFARNAFSGAINYITKGPEEEFGASVSYTRGSHDREDLTFSITGPLGSDRVLGRFAYGQSEYDGHTRNTHPMASINTPGPSTRDRVGGWDDKTYNAGLRILISDALTFDADYFRSEQFREADASFWLQGVGAEVLAGAQYNTMNCNDAVLDLGFAGSGSGNTLWCGALPMQNPLLDGLYVDPRGFGLDATTEIFTAGLHWQVNDSWSARYRYGRAEHDGISNGGAYDHISFEGNSLNTDVRVVFPPFPPTIVANTFQDVTIFNGTPITELTSDTHDLRLDWAGTQQLSGAFGLFYSRVKDEDYSLFNTLDPCNVDNAEACLTPYDGPSSLEGTLPNWIIGPNVLPNPNYDFWVRHNRQSSLVAYDDEIVSIYGEGAWEFTDSLLLRVEARYSEERRKVHRITDANGLRDGESITLGEGTRTGAIGQPQDRQNFYFFSPRFSLEWTATPDNFVYFTAAQGVKTGGFNATSEPTQQRFDKEEQWTYELGSKNLMFDRRLRLNAAVYYIDWKDLQGNVAPLGGVNNPFVQQPTANIGDARVLGFEFEGEFSLSDNWGVDFGYSYNDPKYRSGVIYLDGIRDTDNELGLAALSNFSCDGVICPMDGNVGGNQVARTARHQGFAGLNYFTSFGDGWSLAARVDASYRSKIYATPLNVGWVPSRTITNASLVLDAPANWRLTLWGKNILDEKSLGTVFTIGQFQQYVVTRGAGPSYGATLSYSF